MRPTSLISGGLGLALAVGLPSVQGTVIRSRASPDVKISFKEMKICETTPGVKSYSGYITLPASLDPTQPWESNIFFWFFESRQSPKTSPITVWLQGGPGSASIDQAVSGHNGPCIVNPDSKTTRLNPFSWNSLSNMLYIDQPVQTGFSYDQVTEGVFDNVNGAVDVSPGAVTGVQPGNWTSLKGKFSSQDPSRTANSTLTAARGVYHFLQAWFDEFDQYRRPEVSIWSQSYGGHYAPAIAALINQERKTPNSGPLSPKPPSGKRQRSCSGGNGTEPHPHPHSFGVDSVGIINGFVDVVVQLPFFPNFAINNTYGIQAYSREVYEQAQTTLNSPGGCMDQVRTCQRLQMESDRDSLATNVTVLETCGKAFQTCWGGVYFLYDALSGRNPFDIAEPLPVSFPPPYAVGYLNQPEVQEALGAKVNYTETSAVAAASFINAADFVRAGSLESLAGLVDDGVKVSLIYGDRDFRCNWVAGEAVSLAIKYSKKAAFAAAGYADINVGGISAGKVRQHGRFSFSRIYNAGHEVPQYKPEAGLAIFKRTLEGNDLATGQTPAGPSYSTTGPASVFDVQFPAQPLPAKECYVLSSPLANRCSEAQIEALIQGSAVVKDYVVVEPPS